MLKIRTEILLKATIIITNLKHHALMNKSFRKSFFIFCVFSVFSAIKVSAQQPHISLPTYSNQTEIKASGSVTLTDGFYIPAGKTVRIFTGASFQQCVDLVSSPSVNQNYISTRVFKVSGVNGANIDSLRKVCEVNQTIQYIDGLGRPLQTVTVQGSPSFKDLVQPIAYDAFGREQYKYLPYTTDAGGTGSFKPTSLTEQATYYNSPPAGVGGIPNSAFAETRFEASPLNRVLEQGAPGVNWQLNAGHTQKIEYRTNNTSTDYNSNGFAVRLYRATAVTTADHEHERTLSGTGYYNANELYLTITKDENWKPGYGKAGTVEEYKDKEGRVVLKRTFAQSGPLSTYYVYDDLGNLSFVLPPGANPDNPALPDQTALNNYCYHYRYDGRKRLIEKRIPGKDWEEFVYNKLDQIVLSRDPVQKVKSQWLFIKYDALGRVIMTGLYADGTSRASLEGTLNGQSSLWEIRSASDPGYTADAFPQSITNYHTINYYDDYAFPGNTFGAPNSSLGQVTAERTKGLQTGGYVYIPGTTTRYLSVNYYDAEGRMVQSKSENHVGGNDVIDNSYNFAGDLVASTRTHTGNGATTTIANRYEYDHMARELATMESINGADEVVLSKLAYNELGQLLRKDLHSIDNGTNFLQHTEYAYNERGWLNKSRSNEFSFRLKYDLGTIPQYSGNIANQEWGAGDSYPNTFTYSYDHLNRLENGTSSGTAIRSEALTYDVMGNIASMSRDGGAVGTYDYTGTGNRLNKVQNGPLATGQYVYDANGNATTDGRVGVGLTYNLLNLPVTATKQGVLNLAYTYDATGRKLKKVSNGVSRDYVNGIEYNVNGIDIILTEEGVARNNGGRYSYEYNLTDHLGNVRYTFHQHPETKALEAIQQDDYYAFGKRFGDGGVNKYLYNGKELQDELGQLDYGARFYDPEIARWSVGDPLAEMYLGHSPYNYVLNNPINNIDPDGRSVNTKYVDKNGQAIVNTDDGIDRTVVVRDSQRGAFDEAMRNARNQGNINNSQFNTDLSNNIDSENYSVSPIPKKPWYGKFTGPGPDGPNAYPYELYDWNGKRIRPINAVDRSSQGHDLSYWINGASGVKGAVSDLSVAEADLQLSKEAFKVFFAGLQGKKDPITNRRIITDFGEMRWSLGIGLAFGSIASYKIPLARTQGMYNNFINSITSAWMSGSTLR